VKPIEVITTVDHIEVAARAMLVGIEAAMALPPKFTKSERPSGGLLSAKDASAFLAVSLAHFKAVVRPALPTISIGRRKLFDPKDLERWLTTHKDGGYDGPTDARRTLFVSRTTENKSSEVRANEILNRLRSKPRRSTPTP
jgi:hypothetical protein